MTVQDSAAPKPHPVRSAMEARDRAAMEAALTPDVKVHSPLIRRPFSGSEEVGLLFDVLMDAYEDWRCVGEYGQGNVHVLHIRGRIGGRDVELMDLMRLDEQGRVCEMRLHGRPAAAVAVFAALVAPRFAARRGRVPEAIVRLIVRPLPALLAAGELAVTRLGFGR